MKRLCVFLILSSIVILFSISMFQEQGSSDKKLLSAEESAKPEFPGEAAAYWSRRLQTKNNENPVRLNLEAKHMIEQKRAKKASYLPPFSFESYGPGNFGGRIRSIVVDPRNPNRLLTAGVSGGVMLSEDGGKNWEPQSDFLSNIAISCMANDPIHPDTVYMGTGEGFFGWGMARGYGIFKSTDFGKTWSHLASTTSNSFNYVNRLAVLQGSGVVLAATRNGIYRSADQGQNWIKVSSGPTAGRGYVDLKVDPSQPDIILASHYGNTTGSSVTSVFVQVESPASIAGNMEAGSAQFGPSLSSIGSVSGDLILYSDQGASSSLGCGSAGNAAELSGKIALIDRGDCQFVNKVKNAQNAGAIAVIVANNASGYIDMGGSDSSITIPSLMVSNEDGTRLKSALTEGVHVTLVGQVSSGGDRFIARSEDGGQTFTALTDDSGLPGDDISRMEIGWGSDGVVYVAVSDGDTTTRGLWKSTNHGVSFEKTGSNASFIPRQGWYDLMVGVDPSDSNRVYLGAVDVWRTLDGGATIRKITTWAPGAGEIPQYVHADIHVIAFHSQIPQTLWIGCDGGMFKSVDGGDHFVSLNNDLRLAQNYGLAIEPDGDKVITGTQDNGSHIFFGEKDVWLEWAGGDGGYCAWDHQDSRYIYGSNPQGGMFGSRDMGSSQAALPIPSTAGALFIQPFAIDPSDGNRMIVGTDNVYFSGNVRKLGSSTWKDVSGSIGSIYSLTFDPHNRETAYASNDQGKLYKTTQLSTATSFELANSFNGLVTSINVSSDDSSGQTLFATLSSYQTDRVLRSTDGGTTWTSLQGDLPAIPVHCLVQDPLFPDRLFIGTELGLFAGQPDGSTYSWSQYDYGLAWTRVTNLEWANDHVLWAATYGRGTYKLSRNPVQAVISTQAVNGDGDAFLDAGETHLLTVELGNLTSQALSQVTFKFEPVTAEGIVLSPDSQVLNLGSAQSGSLEFPITLNQVYQDPFTLQLSGVLTVDQQSYIIPFELVLCADPNTTTGSYRNDGETMDTLVTTSELGEASWRTDSSSFHSGSRSLFGEEDDAFALNTLVFPRLTLGVEGSQLTFWISYNLEGDAQQRWDGMVLEAQADGSDWFDLGHLAVGAPYDGQLHNNNALFMRDAWSAVEKTWRQAVIDLRPWSRQTIQLRFRVGSDTGSKNTNGGAWIDDLEVTNATWEGEPVSDTDTCADCSAEPTDLPFVSILPYVLSGGDSAMQTRITAINAWADQTAALELIGFDADGTPLEKTALELTSHSAMVRNLNELFPVNATRIRWVQVGSSLDIVVLADVMDAETRGAYPATLPGGQSLFVPHVAKQISQFETHLVAVNGSASASSLEFIDDTGLAHEMSTTFNPWQQTHALARDLLGDQVSQTDWGKLQTNTDHTAAMEFFTNTGETTRTASLGLNEESGRLLRFLHIASDTQLFWTGMVYFNSSSQSLAAVETYYNSAGSVLSQNNVNLEAGEKRTILYDFNTTENVPADSSWMEVTADQDLVGYELFGSSSISGNSFFAGLQGSYSQGQNLAFQTLLSSDSLWTGLVLINVGDATSSLTLNAWSASGSLLETVTFNDLAPKSKTLLLASNTFSEATLSQAVWVSATADQSQWDGFSLWGDTSRKHLAGVRAVSR